MRELLPAWLPWKTTPRTRLRWATLEGWLRGWEGLGQGVNTPGREQRRQAHLLALTPTVVEAEVDLEILDRLTWVLTDPKLKWYWRTYPGIAGHRVGLVDAADRRRVMLYRRSPAAEYWSAVWLGRMLVVVRRQLPVGLKENDLEGFFGRWRRSLVRAVGLALQEGLAARHFASGTNHPGEVRGYAAVGQDIGVSASEVNADTERALLALAGSGVRVFVDSGAFAEFTRGEVISPVEWTRRLDFYGRLAEGLGRQLTVVAPDKVGDQLVSLERLAEHVTRVRSLHRMGARVIVPLQVGAWSLVQVYDRVRGLLRCPFVPGLPANKAALGESDLVSLLEERKPARIHFLGLGPRTRLKHGRRLLALAAAHGPGVRVSMDSAVRKAMVGRRSGLRPLTAAEDLVEDELLAGARSGLVGQDAEGWGLPDYTDHVAFPSEWLNIRQLRAIARELRIAGEERRRFLENPDGFLQRHCWEELPPEFVSRCPELEAALEAAWERAWRKWTVAEKKQRAIERVMGWEDR